MTEVSILASLIDLALPTCGLAHPAIQAARDIRDRARTDDPPMVADVLDAIGELAAVMRRRSTCEHIRAYA